MTWDAIISAFKRQIPVVFDGRGGGKIPCTRIAEIGIRAGRDGSFTKVVSGMDRNENCLYTGTPEMFSLPERGSGTDGR